MHDSVALVQEAMHSIKTSKILVVLIYLRPLTKESELDLSSFVFCPNEDEPSFDQLDYAMHPIHLLCCVDK
jgi:hypothetical protein